MILDRLKDYMDYKGITIAAFERSIGMSNASFGKSLKNGKAIGTDKLEKILMTYTDINPNWLLTGDGEMLKETHTDNCPVARHSDSPNEGIPLIPLSAMAGPFTMEQQVLECDCDHYVVPAFKGADYLIQVKGASMYPRYSSGDIVACKRLSMQDLFFQWNKVYVLDTDQGPLIKRLKPGSDKQHVLVVSDNPDYDTFELAIERIYHIALVIGVIRLE